MPRKDSQSMNAGFDNTAYYVSQGYTQQANAQGGTSWVKDNKTVSGQTFVPAPQTPPPVIRSGGGSSGVVQTPQGGMSIAPELQRESLPQASPTFILQGKTAASSPYYPPSYISNTFPLQGGQSSRFNEPSQSFNQTQGVNAPQFPLLSQSNITFSLQPKETAFKGPSGKYFGNQTAPEVPKEKEKGPGFVENVKTVYNIIKSNLPEAPTTDIKMAEAGFVLKGSKGITFGGPSGKFFTNDTTTKDFPLVGESSSDWPLVGQTSSAFPLKTKNVTISPYSPIGYGGETFPLQGSSDASKIFKSTYTGEFPLKGNQSRILTGNSTGLFTENALNQNLNAYDRWTKGVVIKQQALSDWTTPSFLKPSPYTSNITRFNATTGKEENVTITGYNDPWYKAIARGTYTMSPYIASSALYAAAPFTSGATIGPANALLGIGLSRDLTPLVLTGGANVALGAQTVATDIESGKFFTNESLTTEMQKELRSAASAGNLATVATEVALPFTRGLEPYQSGTGKESWKFAPEKIPQTVLLAKGGYDATMHLDTSGRITPVETIKKTTSAIQTTPEGSKQVSSTTFINKLGQLVSKQETIDVKEGASTKQGSKQSFGTFKTIFMDDSGKPLTSFFGKKSLDTSGNIKFLDESIPSTGAIRTTVTTTPKKGQTTTTIFDRILTALEEKDGKQTIVEKQVQKRPWWEGGNKAETVIFDKYKIKDTDTENIIKTVEKSRYPDKTTRTDMGNKEEIPDKSQMTKKIESIQRPSDTGSFFGLDNRFGNKIGSKIKTWDEIIQEKVVGDRNKVSFEPPEILAGPRLQQAPGIFGGSDLPAFKFITSNYGLVPVTTAHNLYNTAVKVTTESPSQIIPSTGTVPDTGTGPDTGAKPDVVPDTGGQSIYNYYFSTRTINEAPSYPSQEPSSYPSVTPSLFGIGIPSILGARTLGQPAMPGQLFKKQQYRRSTIKKNPFLDLGAQFKQKMAVKRQNIWSVI
jgi:hypothetical protein